METCKLHYYNCDLGATFLRFDLTIDISCLSVHAINMLTLHSSPKVVMVCGNESPCNLHVSSSEQENHRNTFADQCERHQSFPPLYERLQTQRDLDQYWDA